MQRHESDGVIISCDFCGTDWDQVKTMIEGHHGSVICLDCLKTALEQEREHGERFACTMCLRELRADTHAWAPPRNSPRPEGSNLLAVICLDCIHQAAGTFSKDPDVNWKWQRGKG